MSKPQSQSILADMQPSKAIVSLAIPATLALLAKAVYNLVDTAYIGMLNSDIALTAVGVTVPLLLIMVSLENIFAAGAAVLAGRQLGSRDMDEASRTVTTVIGISVNNPPTFLTVGEHDFLKLETLGYGIKLHRAGVENKMVLYKGFGHVFFDNTGVYPQCEDCIDEMADFILSHSGK